MGKFLLYGATSLSKKLVVRQTGVLSQLARYPLLNLSAHHGAGLAGNFLAVPEQDHRRYAADIKLCRNLLLIFRI